MTEPVYDCKGYPINAGDLIRSFHYRDRNRRRKLYLYHVVVGPPVETKTGSYLRAVPAQYLDPTRKREGGEYLLLPDSGPHVEIVQGLNESYGGELKQWFERPKRPAS